MKKFRLTKLSKKEMDEVVGGAMMKTTPSHSCWCGCCYAGSGGSSSSNNSTANHAAHLNSDCGVFEPI